MMTTVMIPKTVAIEAGEGVGVEEGDEMIEGEGVEVVSEEEEQDHGTVVCSLRTNVYVSLIILCY